MSIHQSIDMSIHQSICLSINLYFSPSIYWYFYPSIHWYFYPSIHWYFYQSFCQLICLSIRPRCGSRYDLQPCLVLVGPTRQASDNKQLYPFLQYRHRRRWGRGVHTVDTHLPRAVPWWAFERVRHRTLTSRGPSSKIGASWCCRHRNRRRPRQREVFFSSHWSAGTRGSWAGTQFMSFFVIISTPGGQSYKNFTLVNYNSRVVIWANL